MLMTAEPRQGACFGLAFGARAAEPRGAGTGDAGFTLTAFHVVPIRVEVVIDIHAARVCLPAGCVSRGGDKRLPMTGGGSAVQGDFHAVGIDAGHDNGVGGAFPRIAQRGRHGEPLHAVEPRGNQRTAAVGAAADNGVDIPSAEAFADDADADAPLFRKTADSFDLTEIIGINQPITLSEVKICS